jgi:hypothetical protein
VIWLIAGLIIYFLYGRKFSKLSPLTNHNGLPVTKSAPPAPDSL